MDGRTKRTSARVYVVRKESSRPICINAHVNVYIYIPEHVKATSN